MVRVSDYVPVEVQKALYSIAKDNIQVIITHHAVRRFLDWRRSGNAEITETCDAEEFLARLARKGKRTRRLPGGAYEVELQGLHAVVKPEKDKFVVLTFNGDREWRLWWRKQRRRERMNVKTLAAL